MSFDVQNIIANLDDISSVEDPDELQKLEHTLNQLFASANPEHGIDAWKITKGLYKARPLFVIHTLSDHSGFHAPKTSTP
jgi:hypothetical protein